MYRHCSAFCGQPIVWPASIFGRDDLDSTNLANILRFSSCLVFVLSVASSVAPLGLRVEFGDALARDKAESDAGRFFRFEQQCLESPRRGFSNLRSAWANTRQSHL